MKTQQDFESNDDNATPISLGKIESTSKKMTNDVSGIPLKDSENGMLNFDSIDSITPNDVSSKELIFGEKGNNEVEDEFESSGGDHPFSSNNGPS